MSLRRDIVTVRRPAIRLASNRGISGFRGTFSDKRPVKYASIHIQTSACTLSLLPSPLFLSFVSFARVVSVNRFPAVDDQPCKEMAGRSIVYIDRRFQILSGSSRASFSSFSQLHPIIVSEHEESRFPGAFILHRAPPAPRTIRKYEFVPHGRLVSENRVSEERT